MKKRMIIIPLFTLFSLFSFTPTPSFSGDNTIPIPDSAEHGEIDEDTLVETVCEIMDMPRELKERHVYREWERIHTFEALPLKRVVGKKLFNLIDGDIWCLSYNVLDGMEEFLDGNTMRELKNAGLVGSLHKKVYHFYIKNLERWIKHFDDVARDTASWKKEEGKVAPCFSPAYIHRPTGSRVTFLIWKNSPPQCEIEMDGGEE